MRTTLIINDELVAEAKRRAAERRQSLSAVVNEALRKALEDTGKPSPFSMPTFGPAGAKKTDSSPSELHEILAAEERAPYGRR